VDSSSLLIKPEVARAQEELEEEEARQSEQRRTGRDGEPESQAGIIYGLTGHGDSRVASPLGPEPAPALPKRFYASVTLDADRVGRDAGKIADEILSHLSTLPGTRLKVSIEIEADIPDGAPEDVQRTVSENAGVLKFDSHGFERY
jgi:hypothetical protein